MIPRSIHASARGFTLVESMVTIIVLALLIPPSVSMLRDAATAKVESANTVRATLLASAVMEHVLADVSSNAASMGMPAFSDASAYLDSPGIGLVDRLGALSTLYQDLGLTWSVSIGALVDKTGAVSADVRMNMYRSVTVSVSWNSTRAGPKSYSVTALVTDQTP